VLQLRQRHALEQSSVQPTGIYVSPWNKGVGI
jgi:hypothetical protein